ncbi:virulence RhuM family protein [Fluviibacter phosphoraccumulans]|uniref:2-hydroxyacid dehydrogenase n=1 Tax=Fluviibacter phosphoraccumulans TaxID=1751046 RepID=A0A679I950_9RHOO|nr:virulence RhuM family protein [Fluviibacter phosphoraccumulans]BBU68401.1 2-hydroxyacid dehydrogenase [Fluviibacter phosphoraccumulans]BBU72444.1 2-hydroxyacid dehydrogenase [Fluviibacter phosphoraccumulans]BCA66584.1 2-hydroxyacid dehydrogenase [Fluviibacter phosphoraccumulans]
MSELILYSSDDGHTRIHLRAEGETVWLSQLEIAELFQTSKQNVSLHAKNIFADNELAQDAVVKESLTTAADGKKYRTQLYNLDLILAIGYRVRSPRGVQFRQWASANLKEFLRKGFVLDDERLKNPGGWDHFDELLARIREIRASEKRFYQKVRDLFALSSDYRLLEQETALFFAEVQNKLLYATTGHTAAELVVKRADPAQPNMALMSWSGSRVRKQDVIVAKNYLSADEIDTLNRLVVIFLEQAELRVKQRQDLSLDFWRSNVDKMLTFNDQPILEGAGSISREQMERITQERYALFDQQRREAERAQADADDLKEIEQIEQTIKQSGKRDQ